MIHLIVTMQIKPECRQAFLEIFNKNHPAVLAEAGCIQYQLCADIEGGSLPPDPNCYTLIEQWESDAHLKAHMAAPHMKLFSQSVTPLRVAVTLRKMRPA